jgi:hypothetical protein
MDAIEAIEAIDAIDAMDAMERNFSFYEYEDKHRYYETNELIKTIFICGGVFITGGVSALMIISRLLCNTLEKEFKLLYGYDSDDEEFFDSKYLKEYNELEDTAIDSSEISNKIIKEKTPDGLVYLGYDSKKEAFFYYSDFKDVAYNYLEVCARKFVIEHNCKSLLLNTKDEIIKAFKSFTNNEDESKNSIFAKLKTEDVNKKESIDHKLKIKTKQLPVPENANKFVYKGKLNSYSSSTSFTSTSCPEFIEIDYKTFKLSQTK